MHFRAANVSGFIRSDGPELQSVARPHSLELLARKDDAFLVNVDAFVVDPQTYRDRRIVLRILSARRER
jgi:hypothetical protein